MLQQTKSVIAKARCSLRTGRQRTLWVSIGSVVFSWALLFPAHGGDEQKSNRMTCGSCPSGYATTGVTTSPQMCKDGDSTLVECVPIGSMNLLSVCGSCPEGYVEIGSSTVPARCGNVDGGRMSQCQLSNLEITTPDPTKGGVFCPPNCVGTLPTPGQGTMPRPPKYLPPPADNPKDKP